MKFANQLQRLLYNLRQNGTGTLLVCAIPFAFLGVSCSGDSSPPSRQVFKENSIYADVLLACTDLNSFEDSCLLSTLPFIGNGTDTPTVAQIMDRVIVSEPWMGERFEEILSRAPSDVRLLLSSVTSIELSGDTPGNTYRIWSGSLIMSAHPLWITDNEKNSLDLSDFSDNRFATNLLLRHPWSNNRDGNAYDEFNRRTSRRLWNGNRDADQIFLGFIDGLYHELGHAATHVNLDRLSSLDNNSQAVDATFYNLSSDIRKVLTETYPLNLVKLRPLALSYYNSQHPVTADTRSLSAEVAAQEFAEDGAVELYSYFSDSEDVANLFAATMMKYHFDTQKTVGFAAKPEGEISCESIELKWGVLDRLANEQVAKRAKLVSDFIFSNRVDLNGFFSGLSRDEKLIESGTLWCDSRDG